MITDIPGLHPSLRAEVLDTIDRLDIRYPHVKHTIRVGYIPEYDDGTTAALTKIQTGLITLNKDVWNRPIDEMLNYLAQDTGTVAKRPADVIKHEFSHVLQKYVSVPFLGYVIEPMLDKITAPQMKLAKALNKEFRWLDQETIHTAMQAFAISFYAVIGGPTEALAECFCKLERGDNDQYAGIADYAFRSLRRVSSS